MKNDFIKIVIVFVLMFTIIIIVTPINIYWIFNALASLVNAAAMDWYYRKHFKE